MLSPDELIKAKREQQEIEKQEEYLRYQAMQKAKAAERARINEILQILRQYPTLADNVSKKPRSILCYDGITGLIRKTVKSTNKDVWHIGSTYSRLPTNNIEEMNTALRISGLKFENVSSDSSGTSYFIDKNGQCWVNTIFYDGREKAMLFPMDINETAKHIWKYCIAFTNLWDSATCGITGRECDKFKEENIYVPDEQKVDKYFKINLLYGK